MKYFDIKECKWCGSKNVENMYVKATGVYFAGREVTSYYDDKPIKICPDCGRITVGEIQK